MKDLPSVGYGTFCWNPRLTRNAVIEVARQDYPDNLKTHYLLYQSPFPVHFAHPFKHRIVHINVSGPKWPALWLHKMKSFTFRSREDYLLLFDEDDLFETDYTLKALKPLLGTGFEISWNHDMVFVQRTNIWTGRYNSPIGTICAKRQLMKRCVKELFKVIPEGATFHIENGKRIFSGPSDSRYRKLIEELYGDLITTHDGIRYYFRHSGMITKNRNKEEDVDFGWENNKATPKISKPGSQKLDWSYNV